jgi:hypothetical protein
MEIAHGNATNTRGRREGKVNDSDEVYIQEIFFNFQFDISEDYNNYYSSLQLASLRAGLKFVLVHS